MKKKRKKKKQKQRHINEMAVYKMQYNIVWQEDWRTDTVAVDSFVVSYSTWWGVLVITAPMIDI